MFFFLFFYSAIGVVWLTVSQTTIRVRFSDRTQLEKAFPSTSKIRAVYAFVRGSLREDVKPIKFVLCESAPRGPLRVILNLGTTDQTPPPRELKVSDPKVRDLSLLELQLAPSSVLHLKFENDELNRTHPVFFLGAHASDILWSQT